MIIILIVAMTPERLIGRGGKLPWHDSEDLKHFKRTTTGHAVIIGRKTFDSIGKPLPDRRNIVITRNRSTVLSSSEPGSLEFVGSLEEAMELCRSRGEEKAFIIGGAQVYAAALPLADEMIVTWMQAESRPGDTFFPEWNPAEWSAPQPVDPQFPRAVRYSRRVPETTE